MARLHCRLRQALRDHLLLSEIGYLLPTGFLLYD